MTDWRALLNPSDSLKAPHNPHNPHIRFRKRECEDLEDFEDGNTVHTLRSVANEPPPIKSGQRVPVPAPTGAASAKEPMVIEAATCGRVYWQSTDGPIYGPAAVSHVAQCREGNGQGSFWLCVEHATSWRWIRTTALRNRAAVEAQKQRPACTCCGGTHYWHSIHGAMICAHCHPPVSPS
jgi:hypothetical protein